MRRQSKSKTTRQRRVKNLAKHAKVNTAGEKLKQLRPKVLYHILRHPPSALTVARDDLGDGRDERSLLAGLLAACPRRVAVVT